MLQLVVIMLVVMGGHLVGAKLMSMAPLTNISHLTFQRS